MRRTCLSSSDSSESPLCPKFEQTNDRVSADDTPASGVSTEQLNCEGFPGDLYWPWTCSSCEAKSMECLLLLSRVRRVGGGSIGLGQQRRFFCADRAALVGRVRQTYRTAEADRDRSHSIVRLLDSMSVDRVHPLPYVAERMGSAESGPNRLRLVAKPKARAT